MNGQGKLLTHYLKNADKLIIPVYQRNYDWREEHCRKLYQDLVRTIRDRKRWHFFGGIVSVSDPMGSSSDYLVIDGQQRITTVSLLLLAMANLIKEGKVIPEDDDLYAQITKSTWWMRSILASAKSSSSLSRATRTHTIVSGGIRPILTVHQISLKTISFSTMRFRNKPLQSTSSSRPLKSCRLSTLR